MKLNKKEIVEIVTESVCKIISELDWKTYHSAANKEKDDRRAKKFADARDQEFNKNYGYEDDNASVKMNGSYMGDRSGRLNIALNHDKNVESFSTSTDDAPNDYYRHNIRNNDGYNNVSGNAKLPYSDDNKVARKIGKAHGEMDNFKKGNYKYIKGSGYKNVGDSSIERGDGTPNTNGSKAQDWHKFLKKNQ